MIKLEDAHTPTDVNHARRTESTMRNTSLETGPLTSVPFANSGIRAPFKKKFDQNHQSPQEVQGVTAVLRPRQMEIEKGEKDFSAKNSGKKLGYPLSVFNKNSTLKRSIFFAQTERLLPVFWAPGSDCHSTSYFGRLFFEGAGVEPGNQEH